MLPNFDRLELEIAYTTGLRDGEHWFANGHRRPCPYLEGKMVGRWEDGFSDGWDDAHKADYTRLVG